MTISGNIIALHFNSCDQITCPSKSYTKQNTDNKTRKKMHFEIKRRNLWQQKKEGEGNKISTTQRDQNRNIEEETEGNDEMKNKQEISYLALKKHEANIKQGYGKA